jgi:hypothetical protein
MGNPLGVEAPTIHLSAAVASTLWDYGCRITDLESAHGFRLPRAIVLGCTAGLAAAFNSPLSGNATVLLLLTLHVLIFLNEKLHLEKVLLLLYYTLFDYTSIALLSGTQCASLLSLWDAFFHVVEFSKKKKKYILKFKLLQTRNCFCRGGVCGHSAGAYGHRPGVVE